MYFCFSNDFGKRNNILLRSLVDMLPCGSPYPTDSKTFFCILVRLVLFIPPIIKTIPCEGEKKKTYSES